MYSRRFFQILLTIIMLMAFSQPAIEYPVHASAQQLKLVTLEEAEILICILPAGQVVRSRGMDIGWELQMSNKLNQADFYVFWVVNNRRPPGTEASNTIGYFGVNKHTAEVWSLDNQRLVSSPELADVQKIIRKSHSISESILKEYGSRRPDVVLGPNR